MVIKRGDEGENVKTVQRALQRNGFDIDDDGDFGPRTERAVKEFQRQNGLDVDGKVGPNTLRALGLDPNTLEDVSASGGGTAPIRAGSASEEGGGVATITFTEEEVTVPPVVRQRIDEYIRLSADHRKVTLEGLLHALDQFETAMQFASSHEATPDVLGSVVNKIFDMAVDELVSHVPGMSTVKSLYDAASDEIDRAARASAGLAVGEWIRNQRSALVNLTQSMDRPKPGDPDQLTPRQLLKLDVDEAYLNGDQDARQAFFTELFQTTEALQRYTGPTIETFERQFYEEWINAHFRSISDDAAGCIEYRFEYDHEGNIFDFVSCSVQAPLGDHVETGLNQLIDNGNTPGLERPIDLKVRKRLCLRVENFVGGTSWSCGWLDAEDEVIHEPIHPPAKQGFHDPGWRVSVRRFGTAD